MSRNGPEIGAKLGMVVQGARKLMLWRADAGHAACAIRTPAHTGVFRAVLRKSGPDVADYESVCKATNASSAVVARVRIW
jgi:hypothetical protein